jgi:hypothetical protein
VSRFLKRPRVAVRHLAKVLDAHCPNLRAARSTLPDPKLTTPGRQAIDLLGALPPLPITQAGDFGAIQVPLKGRSAAILKAR